MLNQLDLLYMSPLLIGLLSASSTYVICELRNKNSKYISVSISFLFAFVIISLTSYISSLLEDIELLDFIPNYLLHGTLVCVSMAIPNCIISSSLFSNLSTLIRNSDLFKDNHMYLCTMERPRVDIPAQSSGPTSTFAPGAGTPGQ